MHNEVADFIKRSAGLVAPDRTLGRVIEVGSRDVNGTVRDVLTEAGYEWAFWLGIDCMDGPGVDIVSPAEVALGVVDSGSFDLAVTTEVLEHAQQWRMILAALVRVVKPGGHLIVTCAGPGRPPHGVSGAPLPAPGEHYANVSLLEVTALLTAACDVLKGEEGPPGDTRVVVRVREGFRS